MNDPKILSRKELYQLVWSKPLTRLSEEYSISVRGLKTKCLENDVPLPKMGHWQKLKYNKQNEVIGLPNPGFDPKIALEDNEETSPLMKLSGEIEKDHASYIKTPIRYKNHPLIEATRKYWKAMVRDGDYSLRDRALSINVTKSTEQRALRFMGVLIGLLEKRGHSIRRESHATFALVFNIRVEIYLREVYRRIPAKKGSRTFDSEPTGVLAIKTNRWYREKEWRDNKAKKIEDMLPTIIAKIELDALEELEWQKNADIQRKRTEAEEMERRQQQVLIDNEILKTKKLLTDAKNYELANEIRQYANALEESSGIITNELEVYLKWSRSKADWIDPLLEDKDQLLGDYNKYAF